MSSTNYYSNTAFERDRVLPTKKVGLTSENTELSLVSFDKLQDSQVAKRNRAELNKLLRANTDDSIPFNWLTGTKMARP